MAAPTYADEVKLFGKWSYEGINLNDISLEDYIAVKAKDVVYLPHTGASSLRPPQSLAAAVLCCARYCCCCRVSPPPAAFNAASPSVARHSRS